MIKAALGVLIVLIGLYVYSRFGAPIPISVNSVTSVKDSMFTATGQGKASAVPDEAVLNVGIRSIKPTVQAAQNEANTALDKMNTSLKNLGIDKKDIKTENYSVNPQYTPENNRIEAYVVESSYTITFHDISKVNQVTDAATQNGFNVVGSIQFRFSDAQQKELLKEARAQAVKEAKSKAESLATAAGIHLGRIVNVQEDQPNNIFPMMAKTEASGPVLDTQTPPVEPGTGEITSTITISYEIY